MSASTATGHVLAPKYASLEVLHIQVYEIDNDLGDNKRELMAMVKMNYVV